MPASEVLLSRSCSAVRTPRVSEVLSRFVRTSVMVPPARLRTRVDLGDEVDGALLQGQLGGRSAVEGSPEDAVHREVGRDAGLRGEVDRRRPEVVDVGDEAEGGARAGAGRREQRAPLDDGVPVGRLNGAELAPRPA